MTATRPRALATIACVVTLLVTASVALAAAKKRPESVATADSKASLARVALAQAEQKKTVTQVKFMAVADKLRGNPGDTPEVVAARKAVDDAKSVYETERARVLTVITTQPSYKDLVKERTQAEAALKAAQSVPAKDSDPEAIADAAANVVLAQSAVSRAEDASCGKDEACSAAKTKLDASQKSLIAARAQADASIATNPEYVSARADFDKATADLATAQMDYQSRLVEDQQARDRASRRK